MGFFGSGVCGHALVPAREAERRRTEAPLSLPVPRARELSVPATESPSVPVDEGPGSFSWFRSRRQTKTRTTPWPSQRTSDQSQSPLFARLPHEVRSIVFHQVLTGHVLHIIHLPRKLAHITCPSHGEEDISTRGHECWKHHLVYSSYSTAPKMYCGPRYGSVEHGGFLPLLRSCRRVYAESIDLLYSGNHFDVRHLDTVSDLSRTVLPARFRQIRSLALRWDVRIPLYVPRCEVDEMKQDEQKWEAFWALLASMQGLRQLRVRLTGDIFPMPDSHVMLLEQLRQVKQCESFEVTLPWPVEDIVSVMGPTPFLLISSTVPD